MQIFKKVQRAFEKVLACISCPQAVVWPPPDLEDRPYLAWSGTLRVLPGTHLKHYVRTKTTKLFIFSANAQIPNLVYDLTKFLIA